MPQTTTLGEREFGQKLQRLDALVQQAEHFADPQCRDHARRIVQALLELHGFALSRILEHVAAAGHAGEAILAACARDGVSGGLLLLHGLHPEGIEQRVRSALDSVRPYLGSHGGSVELVEIADGVVRLRLEGNCDGCPSSAATMRQTIEEAICAIAPEVVSIEVEGMVEPPVAVESSLRFALPVV